MAAAYSYSSNHHQINKLVVFLTSLYFTIFILEDNFYVTARLIVAVFQLDTFCFLLHYDIPSSNYTEMSFSKPISEDSSKKKLYSVVVT